MQFPFRVWFTAAAAGAMLIFSIAPASAQDAREGLSPNENRPRDESAQREGCGQGPWRCVSHPMPGS